MRLSSCWILPFAAGLALSLACQEDSILPGPISAEADEPRGCIQSVGRAPLRKDSFDADGDGRSDNIEVVKTPFKYPYLARWAWHPELRDEDAIWAVANHLLVTFSPDPGPAGARERLQDIFKLDSLDVQPLPLRGTYVVEAPWRPGSHPEQGPPTYLLAEANRVRRHDDVLRAVPDFLYFSLSQPNDPKFDRQDDLVRIGALSAWEISKGNSGIRVAVLDTGLTTDHDDLKMNLAGIGWDFHNNDKDPTDDNSHGTYCAGILGAKGDNGEGVAGVNWQVSILPVKILDLDGCGTTANPTSTVSLVVRSKGAGLTEAFVTTPG